MDHLTYHRLRKYIDMDEYLEDNAEEFEEITEHIMECGDCGRMYRRMLYACQIVDEFSSVEYEGYLAVEKRLWESYQLERLLANTKEQAMEQRILTWLKKKRSGVENSLKVFLAKAEDHEISGMIRNAAEQFSVLNRMQPLAYGAVRGREESVGQTTTENNVLASNILVTENQASKIILDGEGMQLVIRLEYKNSYDEKPPMGILISCDRSIEPMAKTGVYQNRAYVIEFSFLTAGEYMLYLED